MIYLLIFGGVALFVLLLKAITKNHVRRTFMAHYVLARDKGRTNKESVSDAINFFRYRHPFNKLTDVDVRNLSEVAYRLDNPRFIAYLMQKAEQEMSVSVIKRLALQESAKAVAQEELGLRRGADEEQVH